MAKMNKAGVALLAGGFGLVAGYVKCMKDFAKKYETPDGWVRVSPFKGFSISMRDRKKKEES